MLSAWNGCWCQSEKRAWAKRKGVKYYAQMLDSSFEVKSTILVYLLLT
jgi:hypothetical protein